MSVKYLIYCQSRLKTKMYLERMVYMVYGLNHSYLLCTFRNKLEHRKFHMNTKKKNFFRVKVIEHWNRLSGEAVESPSLEIFKIYLDPFLCNLL